MKKIYITKEYKYLNYNKHAIKFTKKTFLDKETYFKIDEKIDNVDLYIIGGGYSDEDLMEVFDIAYHSSINGVKSIHIIMPYFRYSTMERAIKDGEIVKAKTRAVLLSSIPKARNGNYIYLFDLHSEGIIHYFENATHTKHIYCKNLIFNIINKIGSENIVLGATDAGRAKWLISYGKELNLPVALILKNRTDNGIQTLSINADVLDKDIVIYDDMIRSGSTIEEAVISYKKEGAKDIYVITTHGLFLNKKLLDNPNIKKFYSLNTHPNSQFKHDKYEVLSINSLINNIIN